MTEAFSVAIADADGNFYTATVPAGSFVRNAARTRLAFHDLTGTRANGLTQVVLFADRRSGGMRFRLRGRKLDLSGADKALITTSLGFGPDAFGGTRAGFSGTTEISRKDFGIDINLPMDGGGVVVGDTVKVILEIEAVLQPGD